MILKEYKIGKDRFMQTYAGETATVSFYNGSRHDMALVPFFEPWVVWYSCATFYENVPWEKVDEYLETVGK